MTLPRTAIDEIERVRNLLAFFLVGSFVTVIPFLLFKTIAEPNKEIIVYMVGQLSGMATTVLGFYFVNKVGQDALDAKRTENSRTMIETVKSAVETMGTASTGDSASAFRAADDVAAAATDKAAEIKTGVADTLDLGEFPPPPDKSGV